MLCGFEQKVDDFVGGPRVIAFSISNNKNDFDSISICKIFNPDCENMESDEFQEKLSALTKGGNKLFMAGWYGAVQNQWDGKLTTIVKCQRTFIASIEFEANGLKEFLETGKLSDDPPVLEAKISSIQWEQGGVFAWSKTQWNPEGLQIMIEEGSSPQMCLFGANPPRGSDMLSIEFSDFTTAQ